LCATLDGALVARTAETRDCFFSAPGDGWWAALLQANDVSSEAETEIARVSARNLLGGNVDFALEQTGSGTNGIQSQLIFILVFIYGRFCGGKVVVQNVTGGCANHGGFCCFHVVVTEIWRIGWSV